jgi:CubicO group peptidase (beta-lactamase class C family)
MFSEADYAGVSFGLGFATDLKTAEYFWGGVFSTFFFINPREGVIGLLMTQHLPSNTYPLRRDFRDAVRSATSGRSG